MTARPLGAKFTPADQAEMVRLYRDEFWSLTEVASKFGCHHTTVRLWCDRAGVARRSPAEQRAARDVRLAQALDGPPPTEAAKELELERLRDMLARATALIGSWEKREHAQRQVLWPAAEETR